ncbi:hypothetical protein lerEdw1_009529 [Lerista edwardsae]|nr:hypothetical protein lerEdw1_009529 [Lerista edwardsae]
MLFGLALQAYQAVPMDQEIGMDSLLDLSFLTEEEQEAIAEVLRRDSQLQLLEEGRIRRCLRLFNKAGEQNLKQPAGLGDLEVIREPPAEEEKEIVLEVPEAVDGLPNKAVTRLSQPDDTQVAILTAQDVIQPPEPMTENELERSNSFSSLSSETGEEEQQTDAAPAIKVTAQSNGDHLRNGQEEASASSPAKGDVRSPRTELLNTSSSYSSLSSSTMSGSMMSVFSDNDIGNIEVRGAVQFSLYFDARKRELRIQVIQCRDLAEAKKQRSDPQQESRQGVSRDFCQPMHNHDRIHDRITWYVKTYLLPDKSNHGKRKTAVKKKSLDPIFNETLKYKIERADLPGRVLNLSVWHHDSLSRNLFMGEVEIALNTWDWSNTSPQWFNLQPRTPVTPDALSCRGYLNLALKFIPAGSEGAGLPPSGELHIWLKDAQNLIPHRGSTTDSCVQCYILPDDSKSSRQKTRIAKKSLSPTFNHTMVYDGFQATDLAEACAEFTVWDHDKFSKQQLGGIRLSLGTGVGPSPVQHETWVAKPKLAQPFCFYAGHSYGLSVPWMDSTEEEQHVWEMVLKQTGQWVEAGLPLRTSLTPRT